MNAGQQGWVHLDLAPGEYDILCFLSNFTATPPKSHLEQRMHRILVVK
jgi:hypothetical protein